MFYNKMDQNEIAYRNLLMEKKEKLINENLMIASKQQLALELRKQNHEKFIHQRLESMYNQKIIKEKKIKEGIEDLAYIKEFKQKKLQKVQ